MNQAEEALGESDKSKNETSPENEEFKSRLVGVFAVIMVDEADKLKSRRSKRSAPDGSEVM